MAAPLFTLTAGDGLAARIGVTREALAGAKLVLKSNIKRGDMVVIDGGLELVDDVTITLDEDGKINDDTGIQLLADDESLGLENSLQWQVNIKNARAQGFAKSVTSWWINAGANGATVSLDDQAKVPGQVAAGTSRGPRGFGVDDVQRTGDSLQFGVQGSTVGTVDISDLVFNGDMDDITDAGVTGKASARANTPQEGRDAIDAVSAADVDGLVVESLASDDAPAAAAALAAESAVDTYVSGELDLVNGTTADDGVGVHWGIKDAVGRKQIAANTDGTVDVPLPNLAGAKLRSVHSPNRYLKGSRDTDGRLAEDALDKDGCTPRWVLDRHAVRGGFVQKGDTGWAPTGGSRVVWMGDSITKTGAYVDTADPDNDNITLGGLTAMIQTRVPSLRYTYNAARSGRTSRELMRRWDTDVVAKNPNVFHLLAGTNDVGFGIMPHEETIANLRWMIREAKKLGCVVFIGTIPPRSDNDALLDDIEAVNVAIRSLAATEGAHLIDYHSALVDPANGRYKSGYTLDNLHPSIGAQKVMANVAAEVMNRVLVQGSLPVATSQRAEARNLIPNACFLTDTNADGTPDGWTAGGTASSSTISLVTDADFVGKALRLQFTGASDRALTTTINSGFAVGDTIAFCGKFKAVVEAGSGSYSIKVGFTGASGRYIMLCPINAYSAVDSDGLGWFYIEGVVPTGTTALDVVLTAHSGSGDLHLGQPTIYVLGEEGLPA